MGVEQFLFRGWPPDVEWWLVRVPLAQLKTFKFANNQTWIDLTKGGRLVNDGAANVDTVPVAENTNANIKEVAALVLQGRRFPELILIARQRQGPIVIMEGHTRATAYVLAGCPDPVDYAVRKPGSERASAVQPTQGKAIDRARELNRMPGSALSESETPRPVLPTSGGRPSAGQPERLGRHIAGDTLPSRP